MKTLLLCILGLFTMIVSNAQPEIAWQKNYGGQNYDEANSIKQTSDGGYIVAGYSSSGNFDVSVNNGEKDIWIVKLDEVGTIVWEQSYGGSKNDIANDIIQTIDGGYILIGTSESDDFIGISGYNGYEDIIILKLNNLGILEWGKFYGGTNNDEGFSIQETSDGNYIASGLEGSQGTFQFWVAKLNSFGEIDDTWGQITYGNQYNDGAYDIIKTNDGGFVAVGFTKYAIQGVGIETDFWIKKFDAAGNVNWNKIIGGSGTDVAKAIQQTLDGGYIVTGTTRSNDAAVTNYHAKLDIWVVKLDFMGDIEWEVALGGSEDDQSTSVFQTADGNYVVSGFANSMDGDVSNAISSIYDADFWIVKLDSNGVILWDKSLGGSIEDNNYSAQQTEDGGYILAGSTNSNNFDVSGTNGGYDFWVIKLNPESLGIDDITEHEQNVIIYPNPTASKINVSTKSDLVNVEIYSSIGVHIATTTQNQIDVTTYKSGLYLLIIKTQKGIAIKKLIIY